MRPRTAQSLRGPARSLGDVMKLGYFHQIRQLISKGMDVECRDSCRRTPLILCAFMEPEEWAVSTAMLLIEQGVIVGDRDCLGRNSLHYASIYERQRLVRVLLGAIDFNLGQADTTGNTALHYAAMSGNVTICQLLAQSFKKYRINANQVNSRGRTSMEEALLAGNMACARAIEYELTSGGQQGSFKDVRLADDIVLVSSFSFSESQNGFPATSDRKVTRPASAAALDRGQSAMSITANRGRASVSLRIRSSSGIRTRGYHRNSQNPLYANGYRRDDDIIYCAPEDDFRNKPDYVCKLVNLPFDPQIWDQVSMLGSANQKSGCWPDTSQAPQRVTDWRMELQRLFKVYEHQCSSSWRAARKWEKPTQTPDFSPGPEEDDKVKKGRNLNNLSRSGHGKENSPELKRRVPSVRQRKMPSGRLASVTSVEGSLDTSLESINSGMSIKRRGPERESSAGRPESSTSKLRPRSSKEPNSSPQPASLSFTPPSLRPEPSSEQHRVEDSTSQLADATRKPSKPSSSNQDGTNPATVHVSDRAPPSSTQLLTAPPTETPPPAARNYKESSSPNAGSTSTRLPTITVVADTPGVRDTLDINQQQVDTSRLWVQNPYDDDNEEEEEEEEEEEDNDNCDGDSGS